GAAFAAAGEGVRWLGAAIGWLTAPLAWLHELVRQSAQPLWADIAVTAGVLSLAALLLGGARAAAKTIAVFAAMALGVIVLGLDRGGLPVVSTRQWGGLLVTLVVSVTGIVASMPVGMALALGRRSDIPLIRILSVAFIEFWRGVPLITVLFFATYMLPLFLPGNFTLDGLVRVLVGIALFAGAYNAEVIRGGLQAIPRGQGEAAAALGLSYWKTTRLVVMPQALRHVIPGLVNSFIALFKDTTLVLIVSIFDLLGQLRAAFSDPNWATPTTLFTGFAFTGAIYFVFCFGMSRYSLFVERRLNAHRRR
ncbi:MAG: amino acid ABC transporter permease, partial [Xanthobacteraceae bacterium]